MPENVNYAVKSSFLLSFLESVPNVANELKDQNTQEGKFETVGNLPRTRLCSFWFTEVRHLILH